MPELAMSFLGTPKVELNGDAIQLDRRSSLALLAFLVLTGRSHSRDEIAALLAGDVPDSTARKRLRNALADLVAHGLGNYLLTDRHAVAFDATLRHSLDVRIFSDLLRPEHFHDADQLLWASQRCDLELLSGLTLHEAPEFDVWLLHEREHQRQQATRVAHFLLERYLLTDNLDAGITLARRCLAIDPWQEATHRYLIRLLARNGQRADALAQYERCRRILAEDLGVEPDAETTAVAERLRVRKSAIRHNLPLIDSGKPTLLGRDDERNLLIERLGDPAYRVLSVVGLTGSGRASLAISAAEHFVAPIQDGDVPTFADGIFHVKIEDGAPDVAGSNPPGCMSSVVVDAVGLALGLVYYGRIDGLTQLTSYLRSKRMLLVLEGPGNYADAVEVVRTVLRTAPGVTLLVVTGAPLGLPEEWVLPLGGLAIPGAPEEIDCAPASQLLLREASRVGRPVNAGDLVHILTICRATGGLPQALKISAGWLAQLTWEEVATELEHGGDILSKGVTVNGLDNLSIVAMATASYRRASPEERHALNRLAVFKGRFGRREAEAIGVSFDCVLALCRLALLEHDSENVFRIPALLRHYVCSQLASQPIEECGARTQHAVWFSAFVARLTPELYRSPEAHVAIANRCDDVNAAWDWAVESRSTTLLAEMWEGLAIWNRLAGQQREWSAALAIAIDGVRPWCDDSETRILTRYLLIARAQALFGCGDVDEAARVLALAREIQQVDDSHHLEASLNLCEGRLLHYRGDTPGANEALQRARTLAVSIEEKRIEADSLLSLSLVAADHWEFKEAESLLYAAEETFQYLGDRLSLSTTLLYRGRLYVNGGAHALAKLDLERSLQLSASFGHKPQIAWAHTYLGLVADFGYGMHHEAEMHYQKVSDTGQRSVDPYLDTYVRWAQGRNVLHQGNLQHAACHFDRMLQQSHALGNVRLTIRALHANGFLAQVQGDSTRAEDHARMAIRLANEAGLHQMTGRCLFLLGQACERLGDLSEASLSYTQALEIADAQSLPFLRTGALAGLASVALARDDLHRAVIYVDDVVTHVRETLFSGCDEVGWTTLICYRVLRAAGDARADMVLQLGMSCLKRRVSRLDEQSRVHYFENIPECKDLLKIWRERKDFTKAPPSSIQAQRRPRCKGTSLRPFRHQPGRIRPRRRDGHRGGTAET